MMITATIVIIASALATFLVLLRRRWRGPAPAKNSEPSILPRVGVTLAGGFIRGQDYIPVFFQVEERKGAKLMLQILSEFGASPLLGIGPGTSGRLEVGTHYFPIEVVQPSLPWVQVQAFPHQAKKVHRDSVRIPVSLPVRFRELGSARPWQAGKCVNISAGGLSLLSDCPAPPLVGRYYQVEIALTAARQAGEKLALAGAVRWTQPIRGGTIAGLHVAEPASQRELTKLVSQLQRQMARHQQDYLLETSARPNLQ